MSGRSSSKEDGVVSISCGISREIFIRNGIQTLSKLYPVFIYLTWIILTVLINVNAVIIYYNLKIMPAKYNTSNME